MLPAVVFAAASWIVKVAIELPAGALVKSKLICHRFMSAEIRKVWNHKSISDITCNRIVANVSRSVLRPMYIVLWTAVTSVPFTRNERVKPNQ